MTVDQSKGRSAVWVTSVGLFVFALTFRSFTDLYWVGLFLVFLGLAFNLTKKTPPLPKPLTVAATLYAASVFVIALWIITRQEYDLIETLQGFSHYFEILLFVPLSLALYHCKRHHLALLWAPVFAVSLRILSYTDLQSLDTTLLSKAQFGFGQHHVTFGMQSMLALLAIAALTPMSAQRVKPYGTARVASFWLLIFAVAALNLQALLVSGSRSAWGCLIIGLMILALLSWPKIKLKRVRVVPLLIAGMLLLLLGYNNAATIQNRLLQDTNTTFNYSLSIEDLPRDHDVFFARRVHLANFGLEHWQERPWLGYGPAAVKPLINLDADFNIHPHLHNTYIQWLVEIGALGTVTLLGLLSLLLMTLWRLKSSTTCTANRATYNLVTASAISLGIWSVASFHMHSTDWRFAIIWYASFAAWLIREAVENKAQAANPTLRR